MISQQPSPNLSTEIFNVLKDRIIRWQYAPGHRFTEAELCDEFGVSRSPVREALRMLVENDLAEKAPYKSYRVRQLDLKDIHELYDVRLALETFVIERLAEDGYPAAEWDKLHRTWKELERASTRDRNDLAARDEEFHETLAIWTGNQTLLQQLRHIDERLHFIRMTDITSPERLRATCKQHRRILDCIREKNIRGAREALQHNIEDGRKNVEHAIKEALARAYMGAKVSA